MTLLDLTMGAEAVLRWLLIVGTVVGALILIAGVVLLAGFLLDIQWEELR
jgi:hypothetical protein